MKLHSIAFVALLAMITCRPVAIGQESETPQEQVGVDVRVNLLEGTIANSLGHGAQVLTNLEQDQVLSYVAPYFVANSNMLASNDGEYLAQNEVELQTYYDLGMTYHYISEDLFRRQLKLPTEQGIAILTVDDSGLGQECGFEAGDIVLTVDEVPVDTQYDLVISISESRGNEQRVQLQRDGEIQGITINIPQADEVEPTMRYILGVHVDSVSEIVKAQLQTGGLVITSLTEDQPAVRAGLREHDIITHVNDRATEDVDSLRAVLKEADGAEVTVRYLRAAKSHTISITPAKVEEPAEFFLSNIPVVSFYDVDREIAAQELMLLPQATQLTLGFDATEGEAESTDQKIDRLLEKLESIRGEIEGLKADK